MALKIDRTFGTSSGRALIIAAKATAPNSKTLKIAGSANQNCGDCHTSADAPAIELARHLDAEDTKAPARDRAEA
jgi:hypothetical protein